nr:immunoglobulin heavy chain junction region [Macaca mulatta]
CARRPAGIYGLNSW